MTIRTPLRVALVCCTALAACSPKAQPVTPEATKANATATTSASKEAHALFEEYFEEGLEMLPIMATFIGDNRYNDRLANSIGPEFIAKYQASARSYLDRLATIDAAKLDEGDLLSYEIFKRNLQMTLTGAEYPSELLPLNQMFSIPSFMAQLGSGQTMQPFKTVTDYDNWLGRVDDFTVWVDQAVINMKRGVSQGITQPRPIAVKILPQLMTQVVEDPEKSVFYMPIKNMPPSFAEADRQRLDRAYRAAITTKLVPAYRTLHDYIRDDYLPNARTSIAWSDLPNGQAWYNYLVRTSTTTDLDANQIHQIGLDEVARIRGEMEAVKLEVGFQGSLAEWFEHLKTDSKYYFSSEEEVLAAYRALQTRVDAKIAELFALQPKAKFEIRPTEAFRAKSSAAAEYMAPSADGSRPGIFYVNTHDLKIQPKHATGALYLHEAVPGHHFQLALQMQLEELPRFRRYGGFTAYVEGWGLYAESLGKDLGLYDDPMQWFGRLELEMLRAMRLVLDTGMHSKGWTREQAIAYVKANSAMTEADVIAEVERYIAMPAQALAYKIGELTLLRLRARAEKELGDKLDIRAFHTLILANGALPLAVLEARFERWLQEQR